MLTGQHLAGRWEGRQTDTEPRSHLTSLTGPCALTLLIPGLALSETITALDNYASMGSIQSMSREPKKPDHPITLPSDFQRRSGQLHRARHPHLHNTRPTPGRTRNRHQNRDVIFPPRQSKASSYQLPYPIRAPASHARRVETSTSTSQQPKQSDQPTANHFTITACSQPHPQPPCPPTQYYE